MDTKNIEKQIIKECCLKDIKPEELKKLIDKPESISPPDNIDEKIINYAYRSVNKKKKRIKFLKFIIPAAALVMITMIVFHSTFSMRNNLNKPSSLSISSNNIDSDLLTFGIEVMLDEQELIRSAKQL